MKTCVLLLTSTLLFVTTVLGQSSCANIDFEDGNLTGWEIEGPAEIVHRSEQDMYGSFSKSSSGSFSIKLGSENNAAPAVASRSFLVTPDTRYFVYSYASVMAGAHGTDESAKFTIQVLDENDSVIPCTSLIAFAVPGSIDGYEMSTIGFEGEPVFYKAWESNVVDLTNYLGQTLTVKMSSDWCVYSYHFSYAYIDAYCTSQLIHTYKTCDTGTFRIETIDGFTDYFWSGPGIINGEGTAVIEVNEPGLYSVNIPNKTVGCDSLYLEIMVDLDNEEMLPLVDFDFERHCVFSESPMENTSFGGNSPIMDCSWYVNDSLWSNSWNFIYSAPDDDSVLIKLVCKNTAGCIDSTEQWYNPYTSVSLALVEDQVICNGEQVALYEVNGSHGDLIWSNGIESDTCVVNSPGLYIALLTEGICTAIDSVSVVDRTAGFELIPNVITPNSDQINDVFDLPFSDLEAYHLVITNRWGNVVFESYDENVEWDGRTKGNTVEDGVYYYQLNYVCHTGRTKTGFLEVIK